MRRQTFWLGTEETNSLWRTNFLWRGYNSIFRWRVNPFTLPFEKAWTSLCVTFALCIKRLDNGTATSKPVMNGSEMDVVMSSHQPLLINKVPNPSWWALTRNLNVLPSSPPIKSIDCRSMFKDVVWKRGMGSTPLGMYQVMSHCSSNPTSTLQKGEKIEVLIQRSRGWMWKRVIRGSGINIGFFFCLTCGFAFHLTLRAATYPKE